MNATVKSDLGRINKNLSLADNSFGKRKVAKKFTNKQLETKASNLIDKAILLVGLKGKTPSGWETLTA